MRRGEVWWAELPGDTGFRPVVIVSREFDLLRRTSITVAEVTRTARGRRSGVPLTTREGMPVDCVINADNLHTIAVASLSERIADLESGETLRDGECVEICA
jgi:mRNA-degrading endonuclease toxin of MazEF toxin-antitoxin module